MFLLRDPNQNGELSMSEDGNRRRNTAANPRRAKPEDAYALSQLFAAAFSDDPVVDWTVRIGPKRAVALQEFFFRVMRDRAIPAGEVWMSDDGTTCAAWLPPGVPLQPKGFFEQLRLFPMFLRLCGVARLKYGAATSAAMEKNHPRERHFYLLFMAVAPPLQGKGLGSAILQATLKRADELRLPAYLENSNPKNTRLYERAGFVARGNILPEGPPLIAMWREVNTAK
jgi:GNAT superfamily N-acetyltransferase